MLLPGNFLDFRVLHPSERERRHHCLTQNDSVILFTRSSSVPFQTVWNCRFPVKRSCRAMRKLSPSAKTVTTTWVKAGPNVTLERHMVDVRKAVAEFREVSGRRHDTSSQEYHFDNNVPNRSHVQEQLRICSWNPGPRRGNEGAFEKQIAGKWHVITLQEAIEYFDHELLTNKFHVTHHGGCAVLFKKDTFYPDIDVKSHYFHDTRRELLDKVMEGDQGWVLQGVLSRAFFRGQKTFTVLSLHMSNIYAQKRCIAKKLIPTIRAVMLGEHVDWLQAISTGQRGGAAIGTTSAPWKKPCGLRFANAAGPCTLWEPGSIPGCWADVRGFLIPQEYEEHWKVRLHGAFSIPHKALGLRPTDQSCHHETWLHLDFVDWRSAQSHHDRQDRRILLKERPAPYHYGQQKRCINDIMSDHSLSS